MKQKETEGEIVWKMKNITKRGKKERYIVGKQDRLITTMDTSKKSFLKKIRK